MGDWVIDTHSEIWCGRQHRQSASAECALVPTHGGPGCPCRGTRMAYQVHETLDTASIKQLAKHQQSITGITAYRVSTHAILKKCIYMR